MEEKKFDFTEAELLGTIRLADLSKSELKCAKNSNGKYYLLCRKEFTGLEKNKCAYAFDGSGRKPSWAKDALSIYQNSEGEFALGFGVVKEYEDIDD